MSEDNQSNNEHLGSEDDESKPSRKELRLKEVKQGKSAKTFVYKNLGRELKVY